MKPPVFVCDADGVDVIAFRTVEEAEAFIEPPDVVGGDVLAFDALGRRLAAHVEGRRTRLLALEDSSPRDPQLVARIKTLSDAAHLEIDASPDDWDEFIDAAATKIEAWMLR